MQDSLVTVVVPIYKTEKYLDRCITSIVNQTYPNLEIILVDDGSPDNCPLMCDGWAKKDSRIKVIHKENQGLGMARNTGIDSATGEFICFFDSDDYVAADTIKLAVELAQEVRADTVIYGLASEDAQGNIVESYVPQMEKYSYSGSEVQEILLPEMIGPNPQTGKSSGLPLSACCELISLELIKRINWRFVSEREIISEDLYSMIALYAHVRKTAIIPKALYYYYENNSSVSRSYRPDRYNTSKELYIMLLRLCKECSYSSTVVSRCTEIYLGSVIAAMKQEVAHHNLRTAVARLRMIINDELLQRVLWEKSKEKTNFKKRVLFFTIRQKQYGLCYMLLTAKNAAPKK